MITKKWAQLTMEDILNADCITHPLSVILDSGCPEKLYISDEETFFKDIYVKANNSIGVTKGLKNKSEYQMQTLINELRETPTSLVVFIEGYAGCGKSTFVKYILRELARGNKNNYTYYNYDLGASEETKNNRIREVIVNGIIEQFLNYVIGNDEIINNIINILQANAVHQIDPSNFLMQNFASGKLYSRLQMYNKQKDIYSIKTKLLKIMHGQSLSKVLALDAIIRLAQHLITVNRTNKNIYICFDNLDSIENCDELTSFDDGLKLFRHNVDNFLYAIYRELRIGGTRPAFIYLATYRKITAARANANVCLEAANDHPEDLNFIYNIEASQLYNYSKIIEKRLKYFGEFSKENNLSKFEQTKTIVQQKNIILKICKKIFMREKYAQLWNNNYRVCNVIMNQLMTEYFNDMCSCAKEEQDGMLFDSTFGASSIFLNTVCRLFAQKGLWDESHMNLVPLISNERNKNKTSFMRVLLTYMYYRKTYPTTGEKPSVSLKEIYDEFHAVFDEETIINVIATMLSRNYEGIWRRPIFYYKHAFKEPIYDNLRKQYRQCKRGERVDYAEFEISKCGIAYVKYLSSNFEFFSVRLSKDNRPLFLQSNMEDIVKLIDSVYNSVETCCKNLSCFYREYMKRKNNEGSLLGAPIHPLTSKRGRPQLHEERIIFSHIAFLNNYRLSLIERDFENKKQLNQKIVQFIQKYLDLYKKYILPKTRERSALASVLEEKCEKVLSGANEMLSIENDEED